MMSSELKPFLHEAEMAAGDFKLHLVIDIQTVDRVEGLLNRSMDEAFEELLHSNAMAAKFVWAATRKFHPEVSLDQIAGILFSEEHGHALMAILGDLVKRAFPAMKGGQDG